MTKLFKKTRLSSSILADFRKETEGSTSMLFSTSLATLLLGIAATIDVTTSLSTKAKMQNALDSAVLSAAANASEEDFVAYAEQAYLANSEASGIKNTKLTFTQEAPTPTGFTYTGTVTGNTPLLFSSVFNEDGLPVSISSVAKVDLAEPTEAETGTSEAPTCIMALSETAYSGLTLNSGATLTAPGCEMHVHSTRNRAMTANSGINIDLSKICVAGSGLTDNSRGQVGDVELNCDVRPDPYVDLVPVPTDVSCDYNNGNYDRPNSGDKIVMNPGVYCGNHNFNRSDIDVEFRPGLYVLRNGNWNVNGGNWYGEEVTFYMYDSTNLQFNSNVNANFTAPASGDYKNVFLTERPTNSSRNYAINPGSFNFDGAVYLPNTKLTMNSGGDLQIRKMQLIADEILINGAVIAFDTNGIPPYIPEGEVEAPVALAKQLPYLAN